MEKENLIITIAGKTATGKSALTYLLKNFLRENGFEVEQEFNEDHPTEDHFDNVFGKNVEARTNKVKEISKITLKEMQLFNNK